MLAERVRRISIVASDGKRYSTLCLPLDLLPGWLFGITPSKVRPELADKLNRYRAECFKVLWQTFKGDIQSVAHQPSGLSGAEMALEIATAVQHLARQQVDMETRLDQVAARQDVMADYLRGFIQQTHQQLQEHNHRLTSIELQFSGGATISEVEAAEIALAVKNIGQYLAKQGDKAGYAKVYSEMYRQYGISAYRNLPAARYEECLAWLHGWYTELTGEATRIEPRSSEVPQHQEG